MARLTLRLDFEGGRDGRSLGPGKVRLLELVGETGSISAAGRAMGMSYRRAWLLVDALNAAFAEPAVVAKGGGAGGGGATLTPFGRRVVAEYRAMEREAAACSAGRIAWLEAALTQGGLTQGGLTQSGDAAPAAQEGG